MLEKIQVSRRVLVIAVAAFVFAGLVYLAGALSAVLAFNSDQVKDRWASFTASAPVLSDTATPSWETIETTLLTIEKSEFYIGDVDGAAGGGGIEPFGDHLIYSASNGYLATINLASGVIDYVEPRVPMRYEELRDGPLAGHDRFNHNWYRVHDLLVLSTGENRADLLANHHLFYPETEEMCSVIHKTPIALVNGAVEFTTGEWEEVYRVNSCVRLPDYDWSFDGHMSGGRMLPLGDDHILVTVGDFALAEFHFDPDIVMDPNNDLGKIIKVDLNTGEGSVYATGVRNPQGFAWDAEGRLWETEHAAQGGDEVNLIKEGGHYGWPFVSVGAAYGSPRGTFDLNPVQGRHAGYVQPAYAFLPSPAVSNLVSVPAGDVFNLWEGDLLVLTLKDETLYRLRPDGERIVYAEPLEMGARLRDITVLQNGWIAILTDSASIILLREPVDTDTPAAVAAQFSGYDEVRALESATAATMGSYSWGRDIFRAGCAKCHKLNGEAYIGPPLNGVVNRKVAGLDGQYYSPALSAAGGKWTKARLRKFITNPEAIAEGTTMPAVDRLNDYELDELVRFLSETSE